MILAWASPFKSYSIIIITLNIIFFLAFFSRHGLEKSSLHLGWSGEYTDNRKNMFYLVSLLRNVLNES